jgi:hypothetical protein
MKTTLSGQRFLALNSRRLPPTSTFPLSPFHRASACRIIARLNVMGGTIAEPSVAQVSLSGRPALLRTTQITPGSH